jgi:hypothetical protein
MELNLRHYSSCGLPTGDLIEKAQGLGKEVVFRADAAFAKPEIYEALEERGVKYAIRLPGNDSLLRDVEELLTRPVGRPSHKPIVWYKGNHYGSRYHRGSKFPQDQNR